MFSSSVYFSNFYSESFFIGIDFQMQMFAFNLSKHFEAPSLNWLSQKGSK